MYSALSLHPQHHDWGALEQGTEPPTLNPQLLPGRRSINGCPLPLVCVHGVCVFTAVCVHFGWVKCRAQIPSMGHHTWPYVMSLSFVTYLSAFIVPSKTCKLPILYALMHPHTIRNAGFWTERWWHAGRSPSSLARWQARRQRGPGDFAPPRTSLDFYNAMANQRCLGWNPRTHRFLSSAEFYHARNFIKKKSFIVWSHSLVKTERCKIVMNEWQFLINLKGALFACCRPIR